MFAHIRFNLSYTFGRLSTWIMLVVISALAFTLFFLIPYIGTRGDYSNLYKNYAGLLYQSIGGIHFIFAIVCSVKGNNIFRDSINDGTELIFSSKKITRMNIVLSKFISYWTVVWFYIITQFLILLISIAYFRVDASPVIIGYFFSMIFVALFCGSLSSFFSSILGRVGSIVVVVSICVITFAVLPPIIGLVTYWSPDNKWIGYIDLGQQFLQLLLVKTQSVNLQFKSVETWVTVLTSLLICIPLLAVTFYLNMVADYK
jgi:ABC-type transport system involved in multi-copper enzyme maturation permease subunit